MGALHVCTESRVRLTLNAEDTKKTYVLSIGDMITDLEVSGFSKRVSGRIVDFGVDVSPRSTFRGNQVSVYDTIASGQANDAVVDSYTFNEIARVVELVLEDSTTCERYRIKMYDVISIGEIVPGKVVVTPGSGTPIATAIAALKAGQYIYLDPGEYDEELTLNKAVAIVGAASGMVKLKKKITINASEPTSTIVLKDLSMEAAAVAGAGLIELQAGNLSLDGVYAKITGAAGQADCAVLYKKASTANTKVAVNIMNSSLIVEGGEKTDTNYAVHSGKADTDMANLTMNVIGSHLAASNVALYFGARDVSALTIKDSVLDGATALVIAHNGETSSDNTFVEDYAGSSVSVSNSVLTGIQRNEAAAQAASETNTIGAIMVQKCRKLSMKMEECKVMTDNISDLNVVGKKPAPIYSVTMTEKDKNAGCAVRMTACSMYMTNPSVAKACLVDGNNAVKNVGSTFVYARDLNMKLLPVSLA